jgi:hypothetical protein
MSEKYEQLIETGDLEKYKTMMHLAQFIHVVLRVIKPHVNYHPDRLTVELADKSPVWNSNAVRVILTSVSKLSILSMVACLSATSK